MVDKIESPSITKRGIPTEVDVRALEDRFGIPEEKTRISWSEIQEIFKSPTKTLRLRTVVDSWRRKLYREHNVLLAANGDGSGFHVCDPTERVDVASRKIRSGRRFIRKGVNIAEKTDDKRLSEGDLNIRSNILKAAIKDAVKRLR